MQTNQLPSPKKPKPVAYVKNIGGAVRHRDSRLQPFSLPIGVIRPIFDPNIMARFTRNPDKYQVIYDENTALRQDPRQATAYQVSRAPASENPLGFVQWVEGDDLDCLLRLKDGAVATLREVAEGLKAQGWLEVDSKARVTLFGQEKFVSWAALIQKLQVEPGLLCPPEDRPEE